MDILILIILAALLMGFYAMGRADGKDKAETWLEAREYEIDKRFEFYRWLEERGDHHDAG